MTWADSIISLELCTQLNCIVIVEFERHFVVCVFIFADDFGQVVLLCEEQCYVVGID